jgi:hypothetical protein
MSDGGGRRLSNGHIYHWIIQRKPNGGRFQVACLFLFICMLFFASICQPKFNFFWTDRLFENIEWNTSLAIPIGLSSVYTLLHKVKCHSAIQKSCKHIKSFTLQKPFLLCSLPAFLQPPELPVCQNQFEKELLWHFQNPLNWLENIIVHPMCQAFPSILWQHTHVEFCEALTDFPSISMFILNDFKSLHFHGAISGSRQRIENSDSTKFYERRVVVKMVQ